MNASDLIKIRRDLHQIPEIGFNEFKTQAYLLNKINELPQNFLEIKTWRTGILVKVNGSHSEKTIAYRADIDGLPIKERTNCIGYQSTHDGFMHACGHDFHMTIALGVLGYYSNNQPAHNLLFIFQPAEEGPGGAEPMLSSQELREWWPDEIMALHIAPEYPVGTISTRVGMLFANTSELFITLRGKGGHAAYPHTANDMVVAASHLVTQLQSVVSRNINPLDAGVVTIGVIKGGTKQNIIAEEATIEGTIRTKSMDTMQIIKQRIEQLVHGVEVGFTCKASIEYGANYCQVYNEQERTEEFIEFTKNRPEAVFIESPEAMTGEDFGYFLEEIPGFMFWLGVNNQYGLHDARLEPDEEAIEFAVHHLISFINTK
ncbi:N-acetyldiaminopimelate deacetylase [Alkalihalophilus pseudofirmus]|uniref:N-acetyldiaminopimelate deacetylase n=1 Tax=Alkalihalophilus pseudofirmus TaxID=79885 RepID=UPI000951A193|nr:N-acetyldiaminopimelate deacetylase [Alkalihalophilus pseudofirmus]